jgi:citronellol/citronellal dehydrogenase
MSLQNKTVLITGASRGIGKALALRLAKEGANIVIAAKSIVEDPRLGGTIYTTAEEVTALGGNALPLQLDIRFEDQIDKAVSGAVSRFGGIDILINNASAIQLSSTELTEAKRFDLMFSINVRGTFLLTRACIPFLKKSGHAHILTLSPPVNLDLKWLKPHIAYTLTKYNMSMMALAWSAELGKYGIASNALWPKTTIATAAVKNLLGGDTLIKMSRTPDIIADAALVILSKPPGDCTGNTFIDEEVLRSAGVTDFEKYAVQAGSPLYQDLFI